MRNPSRNEIERAGRMRKSRRQDSDELAAIALKYSAATAWLASCPFDDAQPFYETAANRPMEQWGERMVELAVSLHDKALEESIRTALNEGEFGEFDEEWAFWSYISAWADGKVLK